jgi:hypothetical protein
MRLSSVHFTKTEKSREKHIAVFVGKTEGHRYDTEPG